MIYPLTEESINEVGYQDAVAALGGSDEMMTPLKMNKPGPRHCLGKRCRLPTARNLPVIGMVTRKMT
jgi:hypothetical protein